MGWEGRASVLGRQDCRPELGRGPLMDAQLNSGAVPGIRDLMWPEAQLCSVVTAGPDLAVGGAPRALS